MQEIEVKARVQNAEGLKAALVLRGVHLTEPKTQHDTIYTEGDWEFVKFQNERNILRIREQGESSVLTLKRPGVNELHSIEHETVIANVKEMHEILLLMGYKPIVEVKKKRQKGHFQDMEICLDEVEGIGVFVEVERLLESDKDVEKVQEELFVFLEELGVAREDRETRGYDTLARLKQEGNL
ncbi:MAG TPA: class IV adenylate cyclase [Verrucomicrobiae bacterium]|nr:class IV adenylate cyclase [Verrucomicrobiae bacterium]